MARFSLLYRPLVGLAAGLAAAALAQPEATGVPRIDRRALGILSPASRAAGDLGACAVSVGETRAAQPLVEALIAAYPDHCLLLTAMTPTGRAAGRGSSATASCRPISLRLPGGRSARFCRHFAPRLGLLMETEVWPNLLAEAQRRKLPVGPSMPAYRIVRPGIPKVRRPRASRIFRAGRRSCRRRLTQPGWGNWERPP